MFVIYTKVRMLRVLNLQDNDPERHVDLPKWTQKGQRLKAGMGPEWNSETKKNTNISTITQYFFIR